jgi:hypothetical protein
MLPNGGYANFLFSIRKLPTPSTNLSLNKNQGYQLSLNKTNQDYQSFA